jgi:hypothetical protein
LPPEPVSPELVLVDPELAARERARLEEAARLQALYDVAALRRAVERQPMPIEEPLRRRPRWREAATFAQKRLVPAALLCSLLGNGFLAAEMLSRAGEEATPVAVRMVTLTESGSAAQSTGSPSTARQEVTTTAEPQHVKTAELQQVKLRATSAMVERKIVSLILAAPARKLPPRFIDRATGLVKNNVQVVCRRDRTSSFMCAVRLHADTSKSGIYVRYQVNRKGKDVFRWYGYRRG